MNGGTGLRSRGLIRVTLPALAVSLLLAAMIAGGIHRNRIRIATGKERLETFLETVRSYREQGVSYLRSQQRADGSWPSYRSRSSDFSSVEEIPNVPSNCRILLNVAAAGHRDSPFFDQTAAYLKSRPASAAGGLAALLPEVFSTPTVDAVVADVGADPNDLARALLDLGGRSRGVSAAAELETSIRRRLDDVEYDPATWLRLGYFAALAAARSERVRALLPTFVEAFRDRTEPGAWRELDNLELSSYIVLQIESCLLAGDPCRDVNLPIGELATRRRSDGSWAAGALRQTVEGFEGSDIETTSVAIRALESYERLLALRLNRG